MAKESGVGIDQFFINAYDISGDVAALGSIVSRRALLDVTAINQSAPERITGYRDGEISFSVWRDMAAGAEATALMSLPTADVIGQYFHGSTVGYNAASIIGKQVNYDWDRGTDGSLAGSVQVLGNGSPVEWGDMLTTGKQTFASSGTGASIDYTTASTAFGAVAYLQVFSVATGTATVAVQDSADNSSFADITGLAFAAATARMESRLATGTTATIRRYARVNLTGTFTNAVIAVNFVKFGVAQS